MADTPFGGIRIGPSRSAAVPNLWNPLRRADPTYATLLSRAGGYVVASAEALQELFGGETIDEAAFAALDEVEHRADSNTHDLLARLERGHRPPFPPAETRRIVNEIDEIVDQAEAAGELALLTGVTRATPTAVEMTDVLVRAAREVETLLGYVGHGDGFRPYVARIHELEHEGDALWTRATRELFAGDLEPLDVLRWREIYAALEAAIDCCETSAGMIERAIVRTRG